MRATTPPSSSCNGTTGRPPRTDRNSIRTLGEARRGRSALAFIRAVARAKNTQVPEHIQHYLTKHRDFSDTFLKAFKKVRKDNWRLGVVVDQTNLTEFPPEVILLKDRASELVMLYVVGDDTV